MSGDGDKKAVDQFLKELEERDREGGEPVQIEVVGAEEGAPAPGPTGVAAAPERDAANAAIIDDLEAQCQRLKLRVDALTRNLSALEEETEGWKEEKTALEDRLLRRQADLENLRKRTKKEKADWTCQAQGRLVKDLLPALDNFHRALAALASQGEGRQQFLEGIDYIYQQLTGSLTQAGLEMIDAAGEPFDPSLHDAVMTEPVTEGPTNHVLETLEKGYRFQGELLKAAKVKVSVASPTAADAPAAASSDRPPPEPKDPE